MSIYDHVGVSFGTKDMREELAKHGRYLSDWERGGTAEPKSTLQVGADLTAKDSQRYIVKKIHKGKVTIKSITYKGVSITAPQKHIEENFKIYNPR